MLQNRPFVKLKHVFDRVVPDRYFYNVGVTGVKP